MNILLLGSGGREHAMAWKIAQSPLCDKLYIAPGNPGTAQHGENIQIKATDLTALGEFCINAAIDMVVSGPEDPLVKGLADHFAADQKLKHIPVIGPDKKAAQLEGSKAFAKAFMLRNNVQTPAYRQFNDASVQDGIAYLQQHTLPVVLKADGLAAGKGVVICNSAEEAVAEFRSMLSGKFGEAGNTVVAEQFLQGTELTIIILTDGENYLMLPPSKDYKKIGDGDKGLNTGGMGAVSPPPFADETFINKVKEKIIVPTLQGLKKEGIRYKGFLYFGLFKCADEPFVIEYNARLGDPETQVILPRIQNDIVDLFIAVANGKLSEKKLLTDERACATVVLASDGYPEKYETGYSITGMENTEDCMLFHAGTTVDENNNLLTSGGRVMAVSAYGKDIYEALRTCYVNTGRIYFDTRYFRRDIGWDV